MEYSPLSLVLRLNKDYTETIEGIRSSLIDTYDGKKVPLEQVADIVSVSGPSSISRENVQRKVVVSANVSGRDIRSVVQDIQKNVNEKIVFPEGYRIEYGGQFESEATASKTLMITSVLAILIILLLLYQEFRNFKLAGVILLNLPLALIGGIFSIYFTSGVLSIPAIIGFITLFGIATRNGILLISNYEKLHNQEWDFTYIQLREIAQPGQFIVRNSNKGIFRPLKCDINDCLNSCTCTDTACTQGRFTWQ